MKTNVGGIDRTVRIIAGLALLSLFFFLDGNAKWFGLLGVVMVVTAGIRFCPLYSLIGVNTCPTSQRT
ncbi:MAG: DUF2892 domain-containing protein [Burkholderiales bacterium]